MKYNWQQPDWPEFKYSLEKIEKVLYEFAQKEGRISGLMEGLSQDSREEALIAVMVSEALKTSEIEGEYLSRQDIASSIQKHLGIKKVSNIKPGVKADGVSELLVAVRDNFNEKLTKHLLFDWHHKLMKGDPQTNRGSWRKSKKPMQIVSGTIGKENIHFEAPPSSSVPIEMGRFLNWFNQKATPGKLRFKFAPVRAAIAHLYFESIHPFEDGNGRIGRALSEKALSEDVGRPVLISLSLVIEKDKKAYYEALKKAQRTMNVTDWVAYFTDVIIKSQNETEKLILFVLKKSQFFDYFGSSLNERQLKVINKMLETGPQGFEGGMSAKKYMKIAKTSKATATRDLQNLIQNKAFISYGGGRSTYYKVNL